MLTGSDSKSRFAIFSRVGAALTVLVGLAACAPPQQPWTREEAEAITTRIYAAPPAKVLKAAEQVFRLADPTDTKLAFYANGFSARRDASAFLVITYISGGYDFQVTAEPAPGGTRLRINAVSNINGTTAQPVAVGGAVAMVPVQQGVGGVPIASRAGYDLFFSRVDHLLGKPVPWLTCPQARKKFAAPEINEWCFAASDQSPGG